MPSNHRTPSELTETQRSLLKSAVQEGYFKMPRHISTIQLAEKHELSDREALGMINRALETVVRSDICDD